MPRGRNTNGPGKGGPREGAPGQSYPNRSDLTQPGAAPTPASAPAQGTTLPARGYGTPAPPAPPVASAPSSPTAPVGQQGLASQLGMRGTPPPPLMAPTSKPQEPVTAGVPKGAGPNTMQMPAPVQQQDTLGLFLRELYRSVQSEEVRQLIVAHEAKGSPTSQGSLPPQGMPLGAPQAAQRPIAPRVPLAAPSPGPSGPPGPPPTGPPGPAAGELPGLANGPGA